MTNYIFKVASIEPIQRGGGVKTTPLVLHNVVDGAKFTTGMSEYPVGKGAPMHCHNCAEQVTLLEGVGEVEIEGEITPLVKHDSTYIPANVYHAFRNKGDVPMKILWIYDTNVVTRTFLGSADEVVHLSPEDMMSK